MTITTRSYYQENRYRIKCNRLERIIKEKNKQIDALLLEKGMPPLKKRGRPPKFRMLRRI
jgi:hypothetical protein